jgi:hypothetical protein
MLFSAGKSFTSTVARVSQFELFLSCWAGYRGHYDAAVSYLTTLLTFP